MNAEYSSQSAKHSALVAEYDKEKAKLDEIGRTMGTNSKEYQAQQAKVDSLKASVDVSSRAEEENR